MKTKSLIDTKVEKFSILYRGCILLDAICKELHKGERKESIRKFNQNWNSLFPQINSVLEDIGINKSISEKLEDIIGEGDVFDASRYWMDWIKDERER